jgi:hypothetical protein
LMKIQPSSSHAFIFLLCLVGLHSTEWRIQSTP